MVLSPIGLHQFVEKQRGTLSAPLSPIPTLPGGLSGKWQDERTPPGILHQVRISAHGHLEDCTQGGGEETSLKMHGLANLGPFGHPVSTIQLLTNGGNFKNQSVTTTPRAVTLIFPCISFIKSQKKPKQNPAAPVTFPHSLTGGFLGPKLVSQSGGNKPVDPPPGGMATLKQLYGLD